MTSGRSSTSSAICSALPAPAAISPKALRRSAKSGRRGFKDFDGEPQGSRIVLGVDMPPDWRRFILAAMMAGGSPCAGAAELQIVNSSGKVIHELYLAASGQRTWGTDRLREKQPRLIAHGETHTIADLAPGS